MIELERSTRETQVSLRLDLSRDTGVGEAIDTGSAFLTHMLETLARHAGVRLRVQASGDMEHHLVEDVAITLGLAFADSAPDACARYGEATVAMDDALVQVALDIGGRHFYEGPLPDPHYDHFLRSLAENARWTLHVRVLRGTDRHHIVEASVKALGLALRRALAAEQEVFSTKGTVAVTRRERS